MYNVGLLQHVITSKELVSCDKFLPYLELGRSHRLPVLSNELLRD